MDFEQVEQALRERLNGSGRLVAPNPPRPDASLLQRADRIGEFCRPHSRTFADLLINCEEDRTLRAVLVGMLNAPLP